MVQEPAAPVDHERARGRRRLAVEQEHADDLRRVGRGGPGGPVVRVEDPGRRLAGLRPAAGAVLAHPDTVARAAAVERDRRAEGRDRGRRGVEGGIDGGDGGRDHRARDGRRPGRERGRGSDRRRLGDGRDRRQREQDRHEDGRAAAGSTHETRGRRSIDDHPPSLGGSGTHRPWAAGTSATERRYQHGTRRLLSSHASRLPRTRRLGDGGVDGALGRRPARPGHRGPRARAAQAQGGGRGRGLRGTGPRRAGRGRRRALVRRPGRVAGGRRGARRGRGRARSPVRRPGLPVLPDARAGPPGGGRGEVRALAGDRHPRPAAVGDVRPVRPHRPPRGGHADAASWASRHVPRAWATGCCRSARTRSIGSRRSSPGCRIRGPRLRSARPS